MVYKDASRVGAGAVHIAYVQAATWLWATGCAVWVSTLLCCAVLFCVQKGLRPHNYCLPILKRERHREAVAAAATSGSRKFFLGTDR